MLMVLNVALSAARPGDRPIFTSRRLLVSLPLATMLLPMGHLIPRRCIPAAGVCS
jgi:hypothetical protein